MPASKSLIISHRVKRAGRTRKCYHDAEHHIRMGDIVLEIRLGKGWAGYCRQCAPPMIEKSTRQLEELEHNLAALNQQLANATI